MKRRIGILTSGGDCPGLNAAIRGVTRAAYELFDAEIVGIHDGYRGLITGDYQEMKRSQFSGILTLGGTILGTARTPFRDMRKIGEDNLDKVAAMKKTYKDLKLDCLVTLGGNGTHKTANLLSKEGLNVIGLPKTIDNDLYGTDFTFGFHTAMDIATEVIDRIHTTAASHGRCMVVEIMGNKAGWLTLYSGVALRRIRARDPDAEKGAGRGAQGERASRCHDRRRRERHSRTQGGGLLHCHGGRRGCHPDSRNPL